jgi:hypothetical protein
MLFRKARDQLYPNNKDSGEQGHHLDRSEAMRKRMQCNKQRWIEGAKAESTLFAHRELHT